MTRRPILLLVVIIVCAGLLISRLVFWQLMEHGRLAGIAYQEHADLTVESAARGQIFDAQNNRLATDVTVNLLYAVPRNIKEPYKTADLLAPLIHQNPVELRKILTGTSRYVALQSEVDEATSKHIRDLGLKGIVLYPQLRRTYPEGGVASQVLGFVNGTGTGQYGIERFYDRYLTGTAGLQTVLKDTAGNNIHVGSGPVVPSHNGADLYLTISGTIQNLVENELQVAVKKHHADGGTIIVMDPRTGYILGMAGSPTFDPNHYSLTASDTHRYQNPATDFLYEPGSTFKVVTMAAGLDAHVITPQSALNDTGKFVVGDRTLHNWNMSGWGWENMTQVLQHSANVGAAWVAGRLGTDQFYKYIHAFRFGQPTGIDTSGEAAGLVPVPGDKNWTSVSQYTNAFGQGLALTPIQLIRAVATVANGGQMMKPQLVRRMVYDGQVLDHPPVVQGQVIAPATARTLTDMLVHSAVDGEAALGLVHGYNIAAKTGTASVAGTDGKYIQGNTIASIVGYAPAYHPRFIALIKIDHPRDTPWGSMAAAPVLHELFQELFMYFHIPPSPNPVYK